ncbi:DUF2510 domain-containing protein [Rhodococcus phenolicus]|uniref:DUF2510 domain-containing protein n=1 Tax=Rhodococcus phenolicus TaxID=263849 RepID=UPI000830A6E4|nr:DUF2510 domain-containing protein [Rhodococcus phenolicus]
MSPWHVLVLLVLLLGAVGTIAWIVVLLVRATGSNTPQLAPTFPQAGWYPDAQEPTIVRYFDGHFWTPHTRPRT